MNENSILKEISERQASRAISSGKISREEINTLVSAASLAPSCFNSQPWRFIAVDKPETLDRVFAAFADANYWAKKSSAVIALATEISYDCTLSDRRDYALFDTGLAAMNLMLQAESMGIIAHPMAGFDPFKIKEIFKLPEAYIVIVLIALGYKGGSLEELNEKHRQAETSGRTRKPIDEVLCYNCRI